MPLEFEYSPQVHDLLLHLLQLWLLLVALYVDLCSHLFGALCELEGIECLLDVAHPRSDICDDGGVGVASKGVLQQTGQLALPVCRYRGVATR